jgi:hypothetical protein
MGAAVILTTSYLAIPTLHIAIQRYAQSAGRTVSAAAASLRTAWCRWSASRQSGRRKGVRGDDYYSCFGGAGLRAGVEDGVDLEDGETCVL